MTDTDPMTLVRAAGRSHGRINGIETPAGSVGSTCASDFIERGRKTDPEPDVEDCKSSAVRKRLAALSPSEREQLIELLQRVHGTLSTLDAK